MKVTKSFQTIDFEQVKEHEIVRKKNWIGFAEVYLYRCNKESESNEVIDINFYKTLIELDTKLGTTASEQLFKCLYRTTRLSIIKVRIHCLNENYKIILDHRF